MRLINLLPWLPGHSGFDSYVQRVLPGIDGLRLQLDNNGKYQLLPSDGWLPQAPSWSPSFRTRLLQRYSLAQHGANLHDIFNTYKLSPNNIETIYSPFFDALLGFSNIPQLITCHDLTPLICSNSFKAWLRYRFWQPRHCRVATKLIAISRYVADQLVDFGVEPHRIEVIPNGIQIDRTPVLSPLTQDIVAIARHDLNKNLPALLRGIHQLQKLWPQWSGTLRIIGRNSRQTNLLRKLQNRLTRPNQIVMINHLPYDELLLLLRSSIALVSASTEEGFDYPVLEAKAEGIPTLISDIPVHTEFHSDSSLFFPPDDDGTIFARHVISLCNDTALWGQLSSSGLKLAHSLSLSRQVTEINSLINSLA